MRDTSPSVFPARIATPTTTAQNPQRTIPTSVPLAFTRKAFLPK